MKRIVFILTACLFLSSCVYSLIEAKPQKVGSTFHVSTPVEWNHFERDKMTIWTMDGMGLQQLRFISGIEDGEVLYPSGKPEVVEKLPKFDKKMSLIEIREFLVNSVDATNFQDFREDAFEPATFGGVNGFRMQYRMASKQGLEYRGLFVGAVRKDKLYLVQYLGTDLHYFDKALPAAEEIIQSLKFI